MYKKRPGAKGRMLYFRDGKMISVKDVPERVLQELEYKDEVEERLIPVPQPDRVCVFCGQYGKFERRVNLQTIYMCEEHYYDSTITLGKVAQRIREKNSEGRGETSESHQEAEKV